MHWECLFLYHHGINSQCSTDNDSSTASELSRKRRGVMSATAGRKRQNMQVQHQKIQSTEMPEDVILELWSCRISFISLYCSSYICPQPVFFKWLYISGGCLRSIWLFICCLSLREGIRSTFLYFLSKYRKATDCATPKYFKGLLINFIYEVLFITKRI